MKIVGFVSVVIVTSATMTLSLNITPLFNPVTVRRGEQLRLSCSAEFESGDQDISNGRWYRGQNLSGLPYGSIDVSKGCGVSGLPCNPANTSDGRGVVLYEIDINKPILTLMIEKSTSEDNTNFTCAFLRATGTQKSAQISVFVIVCSLPNTTYPTCTVSMYSSGNLEIPLILTCSVEKHPPVISLEWTTSENWTRISLSNDTTFTEDRVENKLHLDTLEIPFNNSVFTCHMRSEACPNINRNCSTNPIPIPAFPPTEGTFKTHVQSTLFIGPTSNPSTSEQSETASLISSQHTSGDASQTSSPSKSDQATTSSSSSLAPNTISDAVSPLSTAIIITIAAGSGVIIIVLVIVIAFLLSSKRNAEGRARKAEGSSINVRLSVEVATPGSETNNRAVNTYENNSHIDQPTGTRAINVYSDAPYRESIEPTGLLPSLGYEAIPLASLPPTQPPEYASVTPASQRKPLPPVYAEVSPDRHKLSTKITNDDYSYADAMMPDRNDAAAASNDGTSRKQDVEGGHPKQSTKITNDDYSYADAVTPDRNDAAATSDDRASWKPPAEECDDLSNPMDENNIGSYAEVGQTFGQGSFEGPFGDDTDPGKELQSLQDQQADPGTYAEVGQTLASGSVGALLDGNGAKVDRGDDVGDRVFVDNVLYVPSGDLTRDDRFGTWDTFSQRKMKGKPRLDSF